MNDTANIPQVGDVRRHPDGKVIAVKRGDWLCSWRGTDRYDYHDEDVADWTILVPAVPIPAAEREEVARLLHDANTGRITPDPEDPADYGQMADAVLTWVGAREAATASRVAVALGLKPGDAREEASRG